MENILPFEVFNKIDLRQFKKFLVKNYFQNYTFIFPALIGIFLLYLGIKDGFKVNGNSITLGNSNLFLGFILIINTIYQISKESKGILQIPYIKSGETIRFGDDGIFMESEFRKLFYPWKAIFCYSDTKDFLILHVNTVHGVYIDKKAYTTEQLNFLKTKVGIQLNKKKP